MSNTSNDSVPDLLTIKLFAEKHPAFSQSSLRYLIFNQKTNGFAGVFPKIGGKVTIDEKKFFDVIKKQNETTEV